MTRKSKKETQNRTVNLKIRLTPEEHAKFKENMVKHGYGENQSNYIRHCLFKKAFTVTTYDETAQKMNIAISDFSKYVRGVCTNFNQITRFIQASHIHEDAEPLLEKGNKLLGEVLKYTTAVYKILAKIERYYDSKNQQERPNLEETDTKIPQWVKTVYAETSQDPMFQPHSAMTTQGNDEAEKTVTVGDKTLTSEQIKLLALGKEVKVRDVLRNGKKFNVTVKFENGEIKKKFMQVVTSG